MMKNFSEKELSVIKKALDYIGYSDVANDSERIKKWVDDDSITVNRCRSGRRVVWISASEDKEVAMYIDTEEVLTEEEKEKELL